MKKYYWLLLITMIFASCNNTNNSANEIDKPATSKSDYPIPKQKNTVIIEVSDSKNTEKIATITIEPSGEIILESKNSDPNDSRFLNLKNQLAKLKSRENLLYQGQKMLDYQEKDPFTEPYESMSLIVKPGDEIYPDAIQDALSRLFTDLDCIILE